MSCNSSKDLEGLAATIGKEKSKSNYFIKDFLRLFAEDTFLKVNVDDLQRRFCNILDFFGDYYKSPVGLVEQAAFLEQLLPDGGN